MKIEPVKGPTPWVSPIVTPPKKHGGIRICIDMREANKAIKRERYPMPTIEELITELNGATLFSTLDLSAVYHQFELDDESRVIMTFTTHRGLKLSRARPIDTRIVLPVALRQQAIDLAHASHQGIVKTKQLLRENVWFPGIEKAVEQKVKGCLTCQITTPEPLQMTKLPQNPLQSISMDFKGPFAGGE
ncbi:uncharacterized protein LOC117113191 [Anneissia japonica]|uniref:uncharacterized protein LOC117113191 n=1 Tax=Anneissia japonica TaxID=1529436 RepID=UPI0014256597|nr:uncharacterized protein LOC117113191 [Anneissia japonica]